MQLRDLRVGMRVVVQGNKKGVCRFLGRTKFAKDEWVGVELDTASGKHDGQVEGFRYFQCARANTGLFIRANDVELENEAESAAAAEVALSSPHRLAATKIQQAFRGHRSRRGSGADTQQLQQEQYELEYHGHVPGSPGESLDKPGSVASPKSGNASPRPRHTRNSSDLARVELEALLRRSTYLRQKPEIMKDLTKLLTRRPSTIEMMRSGILNDGRAAPVATAAGAGASSTKPRLGWSAASPASEDIEPSSRRMFVFGENTHGELSTGDEIDLFTPTELTLPAVKGVKSQPTGPSDFAQVCLGLNHMVVLTLANEVLTCGSWVANLLGTDDRQNLHRLKRLRQFEDLRRKNPANPIISIGCGDRHTVALHNDGSCESFGGTLYGKLGHRSSGASENDALPGSSTYLSILALQGQKVSQMSAGNWHTVCCTTSGAVFTFGGGGKFYNQGQLGHGDTLDSMTPRRIEQFGSMPSAKVFVKSIVCGGYHTLALTVDRLVYAFGAGNLGQLGLGSDKNYSVPQLVTALLVRGSGAGRTIGLAAGENHSMCVQADGSVYTWGYGMQGQCGHGQSQNEKLPRKVAFFSKRNIVIVQVDAGWRHSIALAENHSVYTWGHGDHGQLGLGDTKSHSTPQLVESLEGLEIKTVGAGGSHSLAFNDYFKAAQELVFLQRVREFRETQASRNPVRAGSMDMASPRTQQGDSPSRGGGLLSPKRGGGGGGDGSHLLPSPNPLVPLTLKSMLRDLADDAAAHPTFLSPHARSNLSSPTARRGVQFEDEGPLGRSRSADLSGTSATDPDDEEALQQANDAVSQLNEVYSLSAPSPALEQQDGPGAPDEGPYYDEEQPYDDDAGQPYYQQALIGSPRQQAFLESEYGHGGMMATTSTTTMHSTTRTTYTTTSHSPYATAPSSSSASASAYSPSAHTSPPRRSGPSSPDRDRRSFQQAAHEYDEAPTLASSRDGPSSFSSSAAAAAVAVAASSSGLRAHVLTTVHAASAAPLCIELVYSEHVSCTHRFITFQTHTDEATVRRMVDQYKRGPYGAKDVLLDQLMVTPGNTVSRASRNGGSSSSPRSALRDSHIYEYDSFGPPRYTLLLILATVAADEDLWPDWASTFYYTLTRTCKDITVAAGLQRTNRDHADDDAALRPCFRELRPPQARRRL